MPMWKLLPFKTVDFKDWPPLDQDLYVNRVEEPPTNLRKWADATRYQLSYAWGLHLGYLSSVSPQSFMEALETRLTEALLDGYICELKKSFTVLSIATQLHHIYMAGHRMAPDGDWDYLREKRAEYKRKGRPKLDPNQPATATELMRVGYILMNRADHEAQAADADGKIRNQPTPDQASTFLDGAMIASTAAFIWRKRNLTDRIYEGNQKIPMIVALSSILQPKQPKR